MLRGWLRERRLLPGSARIRPFAPSLLLVLTAWGCGIERYSTYEIPQTPREEESGPSVVVHRDESLTVSLSTIMFSGDRTFDVTVSVEAADGTETVEDVKVQVVWSEQGKSVTVPPSGFVVTRRVCRDELTSSCVESEVPRGAVVSSDAGQRSPATTHFTHVSVSDGPALPDNADHMVVSVSLVLDRGGHRARVVKELSLRKVRHSYFWVVRDC